MDDAIVVNENVERRLSVLKESPLNAAVNGTKEVIISIITATLATISAFLPLMFLPGDMGKFIKPIPLVIIVALLASMAMSLTTVPIFRHWNESKNRKNKKSEKPAGFLGKQIEQLNHLYSGKLMKKVVEHPKKIALTGLLVGTLGYCLVPFVSVELFPKGEDPQFIIDIELGSGISLSKTNELVTEIATWAQEQPGVVKVTSAAGGAAPTIFQFMGAMNADNAGQIAVQGKDGVFDIEGTIQDWNDYFKEAYPGISIITSSLSARY